MAGNNSNQPTTANNNQGSVIAEKIQYLQKSYADFLSKMNELAKLEKNEVNKILSEIDQLKIQKTMDKINKLGD